MKIILLKVPGRPGHKGLLLILRLRHIRKILDSKAYHPHHPLATDQISDSDEWLLRCIAHVHQCIILLQAHIIQSCSLHITMCIHSGIKALLQTQQHEHKTNQVWVKSPLRISEDVGISIRLNFVVPAKGWRFLAWLRVRLMKSSTPLSTCIVKIKLSLREKHTWKKTEVLKLLGNDKELCIKRPCLWVPINWQTHSATDGGIFYWSERLITFFRP